MNVRNALARVWVTAPLAFFGVGVSLSAVAAAGDGQPMAAVMGAGAACGLFFWLGRKSVKDHTNVAVAVAVSEAHAEAAAAAVAASESRSQSLVVLNGIPFASDDQRQVSGQYVQSGAIDGGQAQPGGSALPGVDVHELPAGPVPRAFPIASSQRAGGGAVNLHAPTPGCVDHPGCASAASTFPRVDSDAVGPTMGARARSGSPVPDRWPFTTDDPVTGGQVVQ